MLWVEPGASYQHHWYPKHTVRVCRKAMTQYLNGKQTAQRHQLTSTHESMGCNFWITYIKAYSTMNTMDKSNDFLSFLILLTNLLCGFFFLAVHVVDTEKVHFLERTKAVCATSCCCTLANAQTAEINELHDSLCLLSFYILHSFCHSSASSLPRGQHIKVLGGREGKRAVCNHRMCPLQCLWERFSGRSLLCCQ